MKASEARKMAEHYNEFNSNSEYNKIKKQIEKSAQSGNFEARWYESISSITIKKLQSEGYTIISHGRGPRPDDGYSYLITF